MSKPAEVRLNDLVADWRGKLRLTDWDVRAVLLSPENRSDRSADIQINQYQRQAMIRVNNDAAEQEWPWIVVHELLHLVTYPMEALLRHYLGRTHPGETAALEPLQKEAVEPALERLVEIIVGKPLPWSRNMTRSWLLTDHVQSPERGANASPEP